MGPCLQPGIKATTCSFWLVVREVERSLM
jgi:hypothetical protein